MSNAVPSFGTFLKIGDGVSPPDESFTTIAEVKNITGPSMSGNVVDVTTHSTGVPWRDKIVTLLDAGEISFDINFIPTAATHSYTSGLVKDFKNRTKRNFVLVFSDSASTTWAIAAYVSKFACTETVDGVITGAITLTITGQPALAG